MEIDYEKQYHQVERDHWWFRGRRDCILKMAANFPENARILDIGCSSGILLNALKEKGFSSDQLYGIDISEKAIENCHQNGLEQTAVMDAHQLDFPDNSFDILIASDCLEHIKNDQQALNDWLRVLKKGGSLIIFVPAFPSLWSQHDEDNLHHRRYRRKELRSKLVSAGFHIAQSGYWNFMLFFPGAMVRMMGKILKNEWSYEKGGLYLPNSLVNNTMLHIVKFENRILHYIPFPFGLSLYSMAKKTS